MSDIWDEIAVSVTDRVCDTTNEICGQSTGVLDILLKRSVLENSPFKGYSINSYFVCVNEILQETKHLYLNQACFAHDLFVYSQQVNVAVCRSLVAHLISSGGL